MEAMSGAQRGAIFGLAKTAGLDSDALHDVVYRVTGQDSIKILTRGEAVRVIDALKRSAGQEPGGPKDERIGWMTPAQERKMMALCRTLGWIDERGEIDDKRLDGFVRQRFGIAARRWIDCQKAGRIIEALKKMADGGRGERKRKEAEDGE